MLVAAFIGIWSSGYVVGSIATKAASPLAITFWRLVVAALVLGAVALARRTTWPRGWRTLAGLAVVGALFLSVQFGGAYMALAGGMPAGTSALIISCCPLVVAVFQALTGRERLGGRQWAGAALGFAGVVVALLDRVSAPGSVVPVLWALLGLAGFAAGTVLIPRLVPAGTDPLAGATLQSLAAIVVIAPWALLDGGLSIPLTHQALGSGAWLALVNGVSGPLLITALVQRHGATRASSLLFVVPPVTALVAWPVLGQSIGLGVLAGLAVSAVGVLLVRRSSTDRTNPTIDAPRPRASTMAR